MFFAILFWFPYFREFNSKSPSFTRIQFKFTSNTLSVSRNHFKLTIFFANSIRIHYLFHEITLNFYILCEFNSNALFISPIRIDSTTVWTEYDGISTERNSNELVGIFHLAFHHIRFILYLFRESTLNSQFSLRIHFKFTIFFENSL